MSTYRIFNMRSACAHLFGRPRHRFAYARFDAAVAHLARFWLFLSFCVGCGWLGGGNKAVLKVKFVGHNVGPLPPTVPHPSSARVINTHLCCLPLGDHIIQSLVITTDTSPPYYRSIIHIIIVRLDSHSHL